MTQSKVVREALKPCPFCGGEAYLVWPKLRDHGLVKCLDASCGAQGGRAFTKADAIRLWNTRSHPHAETERLREALRRLTPECELGCTAAPCPMSYGIGSPRGESLCCIARAALTDGGSDAG